MEHLRADLNPVTITNGVGRTNDLVQRINHTLAKECEMYGEPWNKSRMSSEFMVVMSIVSNIFAKTQGSLSSKRLFKERCL